jgi:hypothetical protein
MKNNSHKTKRIAIKMADVDEKIVPIVNWINSFSDALTLFCCQGDAKIPNPIRNPYVLFTCDNNEDLVGILKVINLYNTHNFDIIERHTKVEIEYYNIFEPLRYIIDFNNQKHLLSFIDFLKKEKIWPKPKTKK